MKNIALVLMLMLVMSIQAFACGAPHVISGRVNQIFNAYTSLTGVGQPPVWVKTFGLGRFRYEGIGACPETLQLSIKAKGQVFPNIIFSTDGTGTTMWFEVYPIVIIDDGFEDSAQQMGS